MKLPEGPGVWPAFWLDGLGSVSGPKRRVAEVDILEEYGVKPRIAHQNVHVWNPDGGQYYATGNSSTCQGMTTGFHTYGALVKPDYIRWGGAMENAHPAGSEGAALCYSGSCLGGRVAD
jgi:beta-glucanase (GH16 family)